MGELADEDAVVDLTSPSNGRDISEQEVDALASFHLHARAIARERGVSACAGEGINRWPAVHRLDAARLYRLTLEKGVAGARYHAVAEEEIPMKDIAEALGRGLNLPIVSKTSEEAPAHFNSFMAFAASADNPTSS
ncbi:hypothetical protein N7532_011552 [Penicillium argentinense]|uniref:Uncharacterized protein n=1 Tax=Penicillium argentinense TaxID=1131581 RepID=A0A9W9EIT4_9EURO|nr:uncharacterized protein N7532_011552 [Penicillium argentinense]KAJ5082509.1 hypothetical protein N7532_011552 [Penicillium argentinense]